VGVTKVPRVENIPLGRADLKLHALPLQELTDVILRNLHFRLLLPLERRVVETFVHQRDAQSLLIGLSTNRAMLDNEGDEEPESRCSVRNIHPNHQFVK
jgi:hypothetical protein